MSDPTKIQLYADCPHCDQTGLIFDENKRVLRGCFCSQRRVLAEGVNRAQVEKMHSKLSEVATMFRDFCFKDGVPIPREMREALIACGITPPNADGLPMKETIPTPDGGSIEVEHAGKREPGEAHGHGIKLSYFGLLNAVETKIPGETRHQTALRYIREAERRHGGEECDEMKTTDVRP